MLQCCAFSKISEGLRTAICRFTMPTHRGKIKSEKTSNNILALENALDSGKKRFDLTFLACAIIAIIISQK